ncbi:F0F1 ATP synthase subunit alpha [Candidatus Woesebacteria bacterium RIFCSPLOWO2_01_FULL_37_19]|uniref:ATP synthase subunit alpha n=2 Tax=Candidatus Woeseibacteriota TaxID=1752722 RepID=A0A1F8BAB2_9BACT|nr:MAG: F0F1 ATP synthase subunit alpha [Candidatus Woesebacteria bacterium RIFCSPHIGHO2_01_FULL_38_26b]OGM60963.1 MAG: F0F1 ATP synthase subunit alpha [Candidatus Woesebacteria bacterium RIFCSPLOWO2_01_FULL_37_19]
MKKTEEKIYKEITEYLEKFQPEFRSLNTGFITKVSDGIAIIQGLSKAKMGEILYFPNGILGVALNLKKDEVGAIILDDYSKLIEGDRVISSGKILSIPASTTLLGRVVNPMVQAIDTLGEIKHTKDSASMPIEKIAPGIIFRESVNTPLTTGIKSIDAMIPIGRGQRELIIGDRNTGKTAIAIDTIINQAKENKKGKTKRVISIYVAIGQKQSKVAQVVAKLEEMGAMDETIVVVASASDPVALQYLAPYAGIAIAEYFMSKGEDVLIIYDDLTKHAWAYRQISLILRRPSGREAYPGDIFYLHSRLLERACKLSAKHGGGSITALPIIETQAQDISAYIPTNVISITDGQIYLEPDLFYQGVRPAVNIGLSVSRVGGAAQLKSVKQVAGQLRLDLAQYNELAAFAQFGSDMDSISLAKINRGKKIMEILKQPQYQPVEVTLEILQLWLVTKGYLDDVDDRECLKASLDFATVVNTKFPKIKEVVYSKEGISQEVDKKLNAFANDFKNIT